MAFKNKALENAIKQIEALILLKRSWLGTTS